MSPEDARKQFKSAVQGLVDVYGSDRVACVVASALKTPGHPARSTVWDWAWGKHIATYDAGVFLIAWHDRESRANSSRKVASAQLPCLPDGQLVQSD